MLRQLFISPSNVCCLFGMSFSRTYDVDFLFHISEALLIHLAYIALICMGRKSYWVIPLFVLHHHDVMTTPPLLILVIVW